MTKFKIVIPARYASTRLPGKPLLELAGRPLIAHVCAQALKARAEEVVVAADDERILNVVQTLGAKGLMTDPEHTSGTERIFEVAKRLGWKAEEIVVNWQGDEPLLEAELVDRLASFLAARPEVAVATLAAPACAEEVFNPNVVKVVLNEAGYALYFSRAPIPWIRDAFSDQPPRVMDGLHLRHIGVYAYRVGLLERFVRWRPAPLERVEALEQLRVLWHGERIAVMTVATSPEAGVDTPEDAIRVERRLKELKSLGANEV